VIFQSGLEAGLFYDFKSGNYKPNMHSRLLLSFLTPLVRTASARFGHYLPRFTLNGTAIAKGVGLGLSLVLGVGAVHAIEDDAIRSLKGWMNK
jgi:hypothetical protein